MAVRVSFLRRALPMLLAVAVGLTVALPHILIPMWQAPGEYQPLVWRNVDDISYDETFYAIPLKKVMNGIPFPGDSQIIEHRDAPASLGILPYWIYAALGRAGGGRVEFPFMVGDFVFPGVMFLLTYRFGRCFKGRPAACFIAALVTVGSLPLQALVGSVLTFQPLPGLRRWFTMFASLGPEGVLFPLGYYSRFPSMQITGPLFLGGMLALSSLMRSGRRSSFALSALLIASAFYTYFYLYTLWPILLLILLAGLVMRRDYDRAMTVIKLGVVVAILALPSAWQFWKLRTSPYYWNLSRKIGWSSDPNVAVNLFLSAMAVVSFVRLRRSWTLDRLLMTSGVLACLIAGSQQYVTGRTLFPYHYFLTAGLPLCVVLAADCFGGLRCPDVCAPGAGRGREALGRATGAVLALSTAGIIGWGVFHAAGFSRESAPNFRIPAEKREAIAYLEKHTPRDSVVGSLSLETGTLVSVHASNFVYIPNTAPMCSLAPDEEVVDRVCILGAILGVPDEWYFRRAFRADWGPRPTSLRNMRLTRAEFEEEFWGFTLFFYRFQDKPAPDAFRAEIIQRRWQWQRKERSELYARYRLDYLWVDDYERAVGRADLAQDPHLKVVFRNRSVTLFQVARPEGSGGSRRT